MGIFTRFFWGFSLDEKQYMENLLPESIYLAMILIFG